MVGEEQHPPPTTQQNPQNQPNTTTHNPCPQPKFPDYLVRLPAARSPPPQRGALRGRGGESRAGKGRGGGNKSDVNEEESARQAHSEWAVELKSQREA